VHTLKIIIRKALNSICRLIANAGIISPFIFLFSRLINERKSTIKNTDHKFTVFALNENRFRGDLQILADNGIKVLSLSVEWQRRILEIFWSEELKVEIEKDPIKYYVPNNDYLFTHIQKKLRIFLSKLLPALFEKLNIDCVIGAAVHYLQDYDIGKISSQIGVPYIVLHKENLVASEVIRDTLTKYYMQVGPFVGDAIIVHNEMMRDVFIKSGFAQPKKITALGCMRMDSFVKKVKDSKNSSRNKERKLVTLFSFNHITGISKVESTNSGEKYFNDFTSNRDFGWVNLFEKSHASIAKLAIQNPDIDFIIKPKWGDLWIDEIEYAFKKYNIDLSKINNLKIIYDIDIHKLILETDVCIGFNSSVLLESAIASKPMIIPFFDEAIDPKYNRFTFFQNELDLFDVAKNSDQLESLIIKRLKNPLIDSETEEKRNALFEKYLSSMNADASLKYISKIESIINIKKN
jgi:hypothetical protein